MKKVVLLLTFIISLSSFAQEVETVRWRPILDSTKCVSTVLFSVGVIAGMGLAQVTAAVSDLGASILNGEVCLETSKLVGHAWSPMLTKWIEMGCVAPIDDINNPEYYTYSGENNETNSATNVKLFSCN